MSFPTLNGLMCQKKVRKWFKLGPAVGELSGFKLKVVFFFFIDNMVYLDFSYDIHI